MTAKTEYRHGQFCWIDLMAHDLAAAQQFYRKLLGWSSVAMDTQGGPPYSEFQLNGQSVAGLGQMSDEMKSQGVPPFWNSYLNVDNVEETVKKAADLGATVTVPSMKVVDAGWLAFIQDPTGASVGFWQKDQHFGARLVNSPGAWCWNELATRDVERAREFYGALFSWEFADHHETPSQYYLIKQQGQDIGGMMQMDEQWGEAPPNWGVYFTVDDADDAVQKAEQLGGKTCAPPFDISVGRMAVVSDAQGAAFSVIKLVPAPV